MSTLKVYQVTDLHNITSSWKWKSSFVPIFIDHTNALSPLCIFGSPQIRVDEEWFLFNTPSTRRQMERQVAF